MRKMTVTIKTDGSSTIDMQGFTGTSCVDASKEIELALAGPSGGSDRKPKGDFYATHKGGTQKER